MKNIIKKIEANKNKCTDVKEKILLDNLFPIILTRSVQIENGTTETKEQKKRYYIKYLKL